MVEHRTLNPLVEGSSPSALTTRARVTLACWAFCAVACHRDDKAPPPAPPPAPVVAPQVAPTPAPAKPGKTRLVAVGYHLAQLIEVDGSTVKTIATAKLPSTAQAVVWVDKDPLVLMSSGGIPVEASDDDPKYDGTVAAITAAGFVPQKPLPEATWSFAKPPGSSHLGPYYALQEGNGQAWLGRCEWGGIEDGGHCDDWVWARLGGAFALTSRQPPPSAGEREWPTIAAPAGYSITFAAEENAELPEEMVLTCKGGGKTLVYPPEQHDDSRYRAPVDAKTLRWVSSDPPVFVIEEIVGGFVPHSHLIAFEGCEESERFGEVAGFAGPDHLFALAGSGALSIRRDGKELASLPGATHVVFAPTEPAEPRLGIATLEKQLAGDTSMFAPDAIVLAPGPVAVKGLHLVPAGVTAARITSLNSWTANEIYWLAAEIAITAGGKTTIYRAVEVYDFKLNKIVVASFSPLKPLARVATAPAIPSPTPPGQLAKLLAAPRADALASGYTTVFGTDRAEVATNEESAKLVASWSKLVLTLDPQVHEVDHAKSGYAIATVSLAKPGGAPYRMSAIVVGAPDEHGAWKILALHYLAL